MIAVLKVSITVLSSSSVFRHNEGGRDAAQKTEEKHKKLEFLQQALDTKVSTDTVLTGINCVNFNEAKYVV